MTIAYYIIDVLIAENKVRRADIRKSTERVQLLLLQELYNSTLLSKLNSDVKRSRLRTERKQYKGCTSEFVHFLKVINASISLELISC